MAQAGEGPPELRRCVVATAEALDGEMRDRIARHRAERPADFATIEEPITLPATLAALDQRYDIVIVDCLTLWISNLILAGRSDDDVLQDVKALADTLARVNFRSVVVSGEVGSGIVPENAAARRFRDLLGWANQAVGRVADEVVLMVAGQPLRVK